MSGPKRNDSNPLSREIHACADGMGEVYLPVLQALEGFTRAELRSRQRRLDHAIDELGLQLSGDRRTSGNRPWQLDLFPAALSAKEWAMISRAVVQRALAFNAYAVDLYGEQRILRERVLPHEVVLTDPAFRREFSGMHVPGGEYSQFGAFDLVKRQDGIWRIVEHHMGTPFGVSHVLQNRRILSQVFPELFEHADVAPVAGFSTLLLEMLRAQSPKKNPHVLLLTRGDSEDAYFEETFIARHMGISIARPGDLLVRESRVYLKTIRGLELIDVIYRRMESSTVDPIVVPGGGVTGVPGLVNVVRKGNVSVVNAFGAGVADNRMLLRYSDRIIRHYLEESPVLKTIDTFHLNDPDQRNLVFENLDRMVLKPVQDHEALWTRLGGGRAISRPAELERVARQHPEAFVAQAIPESSQLPAFRGGNFKPEGVYLRAFYIIGQEPIVMPGGLTRQIANRHRTRRLSFVSHGLKDTWIPESAVVQPKPRKRKGGLGERFSISSRIAESFYWAGRYLERAENTARQFNILERLRWDQLGKAERRSYWPLLQAIATATGKSELAKRKRIPSDTAQFSRSLLLDSREPASVYACVLLARRGLEQVRETLSPECWEALEDLARFLREGHKDRITRDRLQQIGETVVSEMARFNGVAERTMLHDDVWQFYRIGVFLERAAGASALLGVAFPRIIENTDPTDGENTDLTALLRLLGSLDAYRRQFRSRAYIDRVATLMVRGRNNPSSLSFCLRNLKYCIGTLSISGERHPGKDLLRSVDAVLARFDAFPLAKMSMEAIDTLDAGIQPRMPRGTDAKTVEKELAGLLAAIEDLHQRIEDVFFSHQDVFAQEQPNLFDPGE